MNFKVIERRLSILESRPSEEGNRIIYMPYDLTEDQHKELDRLLENMDGDTDAPRILYARVNDGGSISIDAD